MSTSFTVWDKENLLLPTQICLSCHKPIQINTEDSFVPISCGHCGYTMEIIPMFLPSGKKHNFLRSPNMKFCPFSGMQFVHTSAFDNTEFAGGGLRNASIQTANLFGTPRGNRSWGFQYKSTAEVPDYLQDEFIVHVLEHKGQAYGITNKCSLFIFDIFDDTVEFIERRDPPPDPLNTIQGAIYLKDHIIVAGESNYIQWDISRPSAPPQQRSFHDVRIWGAPLIIDEKEGVFLLQFTGLSFTTQSRMHFFNIQSQNPIQSHFDESNVKKYSPAIFVREKNSLFWVNENLSIYCYNVSTQECDAIIPPSNGNLYQSQHPLFTAKLSHNGRSLHFYCVDVVDNSTQISRCSVELESLTLNHSWNTQYLSNTDGSAIGLFVGIQESVAPLVLTTDQGIRIFQDSEFETSFDIWIPTAESNPIITEHPIITPIGVMYRTKNYVGLALSNELGWAESNAKAYALSIQKTVRPETNIYNRSFTVSGQKILVAAESSLKLFLISKDHS